MVHPPAAPLGSIDHLRAVLVMLHVLVVVGASVPSPEGFHADDALSKQAVAGPLARWEGSLARVGIPAEVSRTVILHGGRALEGVQDRVALWSAPYTRISGARQSWRMFSQAFPRGERLEIWVEEGDWRLVFRPFDPEAAWRAGLWEQGRVRGLFNSLRAARFEKWWAGMANSIARRAAHDFPAATRLRLQRVPVTIPAPDVLVRTGILPEGPPRGEVVVELGPLR